MVLKSRRNFLKALSAGPLLGAVGGCTHFDRMFLGDSRDDRDKVVILGAGLSGLAAAYSLRKSQMPFRVFEGRKRIGGRVLTVSDFNVSSQNADLGGEWVRYAHKSVFDIAKELGVGIDEFKSEHDFIVLRAGQIIPPSSLQKSWAAAKLIFQKLAEQTYGLMGQKLTADNASQYPKAEQLDLMTAEELLSRLKNQLDPQIIIFLQRLCIVNWGVKAEQISALHLLHWFQMHSQDKRWFKISGGSQVLAQALYDRVAGVIPERFVRLEYQLTAIEAESDHWKLTFETPDGTETVLAKQVICTLPFSCLRNVEGLDQIFLEDWQMKLIKNLGYGQHSKLALDFSDRFWSKTPLAKTLHWLFETEDMWVADGVPKIQLDLAPGRGILTTTLGGDLGQGAGLHTVDQVLAGLSNLQKTPLPYENIFHVQNWSQHPWSLGSVSYCKPGQFALKHESFKSNKEAPGSWLFAGEHVSLQWMGTMNGAIESGLKAARTFIKS